MPPGGRRREVQPLAAQLLEEHVVDVEGEDVDVDEEAVVANPASPTNLQLLMRRKTQYRSIQLLRRPHLHDSPQLDKTVRHPLDDARSRHRQRMVALQRTRKHLRVVYSVLQQPGKHHPRDHQVEVALDKPHERDSHHLSRLPTFPPQLDKADLLRYNRLRHLNLLKIRLNSLKIRRAAKKKPLATRQMNRHSQRGISPTQKVQLAATNRRTPGNVDVASIRPVTMRTNLSDRNLMKHRQVQMSLLKKTATKTINKTSSRWRRLASVCNVDSMDWRLDSHWRSIRATTKTRYLRKVKRIGPFGTMMSTARSWPSQKRCRKCPVAISSPYLIITRSILGR